jgi:hypothetical protein
LYNYHILKKYKKRRLHSNKENWVEDSWSRGPKSKACMKEEKVCLQQQQTDHCALKRAIHGDEPRMGG